MSDLLRFPRFKAYIYARSMNGGIGCSSSWRDMEQQVSKTKSKILIAEDDEHIAYLLKFQLEREGFEVLTAADGRVASEIIESQPPPELVLLDIMLPYKDGYQLLHLIHTKETWKDVPVVMLTAKAQEQDIVRALEAGACDYIVKPFQPNELVARLKRIMRQVHGL